MKNDTKFILTWGTLMFLFISLVSCRNSNDTGEFETGPATVKVSLQGSSFEDDASLGTFASKGKTIGLAEQKEEITFKGNDEYKLVATLTPVTNTGNSLQKTSVNATEINPIGNGVRYRVVVFDNNGNYVTEQNYVNGQTGSDITGLDGGSTYTFIVYSIGSTTVLPTVTYTNPQNKTLATASVNNISGDNDLMYFSKTMTISGNGTNYLNAILRHKYSQIITTLNATTTTYNITAINNVTASPHTGSATMQLSNGNTISTGSQTPRTISFPTLNSSIITATPVLINAADTTNGVFSIGSITMTTTVGNSGGQVTQQNISFNNLKITRGVKYNLNLTFTPNDRYMTFKGYSAARINGMIWMRHNLGATLSADPDIPSQFINGNYYQWGRNQIAATSITPAAAIPGWDNTTLPANNAWNSNIEEIPAKTGNDPCPTGWRVPTGKEYSALLANTTKVDIGNLQENETNFSRASVLTSKFNTGVKLTFLAAGYRSDTDGRLFQRGQNSLYWNNVPDGNNASWVALVNDNNFYRINRSRATPIRCIAEYPY
ncbi:Fibrobacter succinogenes major domain (Fib_succ_major) [Elizabethkingia miricola]|nr:Fibrobacter succinogenes major domain (Fib_succ_major) [Elizabethkingia miricola]